MLMFGPRTETSDLFFFKISQKFKEMLPNLTKRGFKKGQNALLCIFIWVGMLGESDRVRTRTRFSKSDSDSPSDSFLKDSPGLGLARTRTRPDSLSESLK